MQFNLSFHVFVMSTSVIKHSIAGKVNLSESFADEFSSGLEKCTKMKVTAKSGNSRQVAYGVRAKMKKVLYRRTKMKSYEVIMTLYFPIVCRLLKKTQKSFAT